MSQLLSYGHLTLALATASTRVEKLGKKKRKRKFVFLISPFRFTDLILYWPFFIFSWWWSNRQKKILIA